jgi:hypothetical protein
MGYQTLVVLSWARCVESTLAHPLSLLLLLVMTEESPAKFVNINDVSFCATHLKEVVRLISSPLLVCDRALTIISQCQQCDVDFVRAPLLLSMLD